MRYVIDPEFKTLVRRLTEAEYSALEASIVAEGCRDALVIWRGYGIIVDGHNRYDICQKHGIAFRVEERDFTDRQAVKVWILKNALARRNLTDGERFEVAILLKDELAEVGKEKKIEAGKVAREKQLGVLSVNDKTPQTEPVKEEPKHDTRKEMASNLGWSTGKVAQAEVVRKEDPEKWDEVKAGAKTVNAAYIEVKKPHVANNSGENEWYTPPKYTEAAKRVMGAIDLDPASNELANKFVGADKFYTKEDDGLTKPWYGRVWLNPPYAQPLIAQFSDAVVEKFGRGEFEQAIVLVNNATDTKWLQSMMRVCSAACFLEGRIQYLDKTGEPKNSPIQGQVVLYFGEGIQQFIDEFRAFGVVMSR